MFIFCPIRETSRSHPVSLSSARPSFRDPFPCNPFIACAARVFGRPERSCLESPLGSYFSLPVTQPQTSLGWVPQSRGEMPGPCGVSCGSRSSQELGLTDHYRCAGSSRWSAGSGARPPSCAAASCILRASPASSLCACCALGGTAVHENIHAADMHKLMLNPASMSVPFESTVCACTYTEYFGAQFSVCVCTRHSHIFTPLRATHRTPISLRMDACIPVTQHSTRPCACWCMPCTCWVRSLPVCAAALPPK